MNNGINYLDLFSGIGGFAKGLQDAGVKINKHYYSEIDKHCINLYEKHFPEAESLGDIKTINSENDTISKLKNERIDLITFGFPCQDLSIAGKRAGIDGDRSGLFFEAIKIIRELQPLYFIFENVKGLITSNNGKDFVRCLQEISNLRNYDCEWQLVNTKWFIPQNRERIYFIGHLGNHSRPKVFPIRESDYENYKLSGQQTNTITARYGTADSNGTYIIESELKEKTKRNPQGSRINTTDGNSTTLLANSGGNGKTGLYVIGSNQKNPRILKDRSPCLTAAMGMGGGNVPVVIPVLTPNRETKRQNGRRFKENNDPTFTLTTQDQHGIYDGVSIRKLTPIECERLQGFPDNWTQTDKNNNLISDSSRYKMLGNAVTVKVVEEIIKRLFQ